MSGLRINGGEIGSNDVQLDGNSVQGAAWRETAVIPNPDALSEVRVITNNFTAETGLAQGVVQQTTSARRSGRSWRVPRTRAIARSWT